MILTCPECATSYFVDDARIPAAGRRVRCSSCGNRWMAGPDGPMAEPAAAPAPQAAPEPEAPPVETPPEPAALDVEPVVPPPPLRRPTAAARKPVRTRSGPAPLVWAGVAAVAIALLAGAIVFREQIVRIAPPSSALYAGLGFETGAHGLVFEDVDVKPAFLAGRPVLAVTGAIRNVRDEPVSAPPVRLTLLNRAGQPVAAKVARPEDATIPAKSKRHFAITMIDPPATARDLEVRFDAAKGGRPAEGARTALATPHSEKAAQSQPQPEAHPAPQPLQAAPPPAPLSPAAATEHG